MPKININSIPENAVVYVTGIVDYCRIKTQLSGEELAADNARRTARGLIPNEKPHTHITLSHCQVDFANPKAPTEAEQFVLEKFYPSKMHPEKGNCFNPLNKSSILPNTFVRDNAQSKTLEPLILEGELDVNTPVTITVRFFKTKLNAGMSLDSVIVNEKPVRYYAPNPSEAALIARGFTIVNNADSEAQDIAAQLDAQPAPAAPVASAAAIPAPAPTAAPYMQQPAAQPAPAPTAAPAVTPASNLPTPPAGYTYDEGGRIVPISAIGNAQPTGGITL